MTNDKLADEIERHEAKRYAGQVIPPYPLYEDEAALVITALRAERPQSGEMAIRNDECWEIIKALDAEGKASSLIGYPLTDTNRTTIRAWLQSRIEGRKLAAAEAERGKT